MNTSVFLLSELVERMENTFTNISSINGEKRTLSCKSSGFISHLDEVKSILNDIFVDVICDGIIFTLNTDKPFFGIHINPIINANDAICIFATEEKVKINRYQLELDSKLFDIGLSSDELVSVILFELSSMFSDKTIDDVKSLIDLYMLSDDDVINIRDSANYSQLIIYGIKDTLYKVSSIVFKEDQEDLISNELIQLTKLEDSLISAEEKITNSVYGSGDVVRDSKVIILQWVLMIYKDIEHNSRIAKDTLMDAKEFTGSKLQKLEIDKTLSAISRINNTILENCSINKVFESKGIHSLNELSIFKSLKTSGLKSIEDALYEFTIRIKNCDTEEDAMYILRGINTRLNIIEDYIYNTPDLSDIERKRWMDVSTRYRELREQLAKRKIVNKKQYGLFFDYDQLDYLDKKTDE